MVAKYPAGVFRYSRTFLNETPAKDAALVNSSQLIAADVGSESICLAVSIAFAPALSASSYADEVMLLLAMTFSSSSVRSSRLLLIAPRGTFALTVLG